MSVSLMAHMVAGYPTMEKSYEIAHSLITSGISFLEVQFPFSEPSADGPLIQQACMQALDRGFTTHKGFELIGKLTTQIPVFLMSYANLLHTPGMETFIQQAKEASVHGLIVPDLPFDSDAGFFSLCSQLKMEAVPVVVPGTSPERLHSYRGHRYLYTTLRTGITGKETEILPSTLQFLRTLRKQEAHIFGGFGIRFSSQISQLTGLIDTFVIGSALLSIINNTDEKNYDASLRSFLTGLFAS